MRGTLVSLASVACLALAAGCGSSSNPHSVASDWRAAANAMATGDGKTACSHFTPAVAQTLASSAGTSCEQAVATLAQPLTAADRDSVKRAAITQVQVSGTHATIEYRLTPGLRKLQFEGRSRLVESGGRWLIAPRSGQ